MFRLRVISLIKDFGIKKEFIIELIGSNRVTFARKLGGQIEFTELEKLAIKSKFKELV